MSRRASVVAVVLTGLLSVAVPARGEELLVLAAASLTDVLQDLGAAFERRGGGRVRFSFGASSDLARQIVAGAPADVFFSADTARMDEVERAGLVDAAARRNVLSNVLVVIVPDAAPTTIAAPGDLTKVARLALADPEAVPAGIYARTWLASLGLWGPLKDKVVPTLDVRAALAAVEAGHADAAIVYATDAAVSKRARVAYRVPRDRGPPVVYVLAPLRPSKKAGARELVRFLASRDAAPVYERFGFLVLPAD
jgi:molybdate transport system substrate-binding protein